MATTTGTAASTVCPQCSTPYAEAARFCAKCGADVRVADNKRHGAFAVQSGEPLWSVNFMSSLMPLASGRTLQTFRFVLAVALAVPLIAAVFGFLPFALTAAAVAVPLVFLLYLHDVNQWEEEPLPVLGATMLLGGLLALGFTILWRNVFDAGVFAVSATGLAVHIDVKTLLLVGVVMPIIAMALMQLGPIWLAARPRFDDLFDGLTFGVASGVAFAAVETIVLNSGLVFDGPNRIDSPDAAVWIAIIVVAGLLKPVIYGAASGIATSSFSGTGPGHRGFSGSYLRGFGEAALAGIAFQAGLYLTGRFGGTVGVLFGLVWALVVAAAVVLRLRFVLHTAILEEALEATVAGESGYGATHGIAFCGQCKLPLLDEASFCVNCGMSARATSKMARAANTEADGTKASSASFPAPALDGWGTTATAPKGNRRSAGVMIGVAIVIVAVVGGVFAAINSSTRPSDTKNGQFNEDVGQSLGAPSATAQNVSFRDQVGGPTGNGGGTDNGGGGGGNGGGGNGNGGGGSGNGGGGGNGGGTDNGGGNGGGGQQGTGATTPGPLNTTVAVPDGWQVGQTGDGYVTVVPTNGNAYFAVIGFPQNPPGEAASDRLQNYIEFLNQNFQNVQGKSDVSNITGGPIRDSIWYGWTGQVAGNQGTAEVSGGVYVLETNGGKYVILDYRNGAGEFDQWKADFDTIIASVTSAFPA